MKGGTCIFTVFTPTFNRARTLPAVYRSLCAQSFLDFEWLVVDDGSTDNTSSLVKYWMAEERIRIRYFFQENQGKHVAFNKAVQEAHGALFLTLDSDDTCVPHALERLNHHWEEMPPAYRQEFSGVTCLCNDIEGRVVGTRFPAPVFDSDPITLATKFGVNGEKWGFHTTEILRRFPFPEFIGERFVPEGLVWNRIARSYKIRFIDEPLRTYVRSSDGLTARSRVIRMRNPSGSRLYYLEYSDLQVPFLHKARAIINCLRFSLHGGGTLAQSFREMRTGVLFAILLPVGYLAFLVDRLRAR